MRTATGSGTWIFGTPQPELGSPFFEAFSFDFSAALDVFPTLFESREVRGSGEHPVACGTREHEVFGAVLATHSNRLNMIDCGAPVSRERRQEILVAVSTSGVVTPEHVAPCNVMDTHRYLKVPQRTASDGKTTVGAKPSLS